MPISIRKLAALDILLHGSWLILAEFAAGVFLPLSLGLLSLLRGHLRWQIIVGTYLILLAVNYVPLMAYAIIIIRKGSAHEEAADELTDRSRIASKYMPQSLLLLIPLVVPVLTVLQELRNDSPERSSTSGQINPPRPM